MAKWRVSNASSLQSVRLHCKLEPWGCFFCIAQHEEQGHFHLNITKALSNRAVLQSATCMHDVTYTNTKWCTCNELHFVVEGTIAMCRQFALHFQTVWLYTVSRAAAFTFFELLRCGRVSFGRARKMTPRRPRSSANARRCVQPLGSRPQQYT